MKLIELELYKFKRFSLSKIDKLIYRPDKQTQLILGANGAGKSSMLAELTPLPADIKKRYKEDGYKKITYLHHSKVYVLTSASKHSFIVDGTEFNIAGNKRVQLALVKEHFNTTPYIESVLKGKVKFTNMGPSERKDWLTMISKTDFDYPLSVLAKLKKREADLKGGINIIKLKQSEELSVMVVNMEKSKQILDMLDMVIGEAKNNRHKIEDVTNINIADIERLSLKIEDNLNSVVESGAYPNLDKDIIIGETNLNSLYKLLGKLSPDNRTKEELTTEIELLNKEKDTLMKSIEVTNVNVMRKSILTLPSILVNISNMTDDLSDYERYKTLPNISELTYKVAILTTELNMMRENVLKTEEHLKHLEDLSHGKDITCPSCSTAFKPGYSLDGAKDVRAKLSVFRGKLDALEVKYDILNEQLSISQLYMSKLEHISDLLKSTEIEWIISDYKDEDLDRHIVIKTKASYKLSIMEEVIKIEDKILYLTSELKHVNSDINYNDIKTQTDKLLIDLNRLRNIKIVSNRNKSFVESILTSQSKLESMLKDRHRYEKVAAYVNDNEHLDKLISDMEEMYVNENKLYNGYLADVTISKQRERDLSDLLDRHTEVKTLLKAIGPGNGLIAKMIKGDLGVFTEDMNNIINTIWAYRLKVLPTNIGDTDTFTYKLPVLVGDDPEPADDISELSTSQQEVINLSFRIVSMLRLDMGGDMFTLDEFGSSFDPIHLEAIYDIIDKLQNTFSQVFIVSHFENAYIKFAKTSDINVLTDDYLTKELAGTTNQFILT